MCVQAFKTVHSAKNVGEEAQWRRNKIMQKEDQKLHFNSDNSDPGNVFFSLHELKRAVQAGSNTTLGRDGVGYEMLKHVSDLVLDEILALINTVWENGQLPEDWKHAVVVPILKPGKVATSPGS